MLGNLVLQATFSDILKKLSKFFNYFLVQLLLLEGDPDAAVKLLPCDHEVMGFSPRNSLLKKCRERLYI
jgi:hypothetical protein